MKINEVCKFVQWEIKYKAKLPYEWKEIGMPWLYDQLLYVTYI